MKIPFAILAGGKSRRMGRDKAFVEVDGTPMIERVIAAVRPGASTITLIANEPEKFKKFGYPVFADTIAGMGPLSGLVTAFEVIDGNRIFMVACDMPYVSPEIVEFIIKCGDRPGEALMPIIGGREQGLMAIYRRGTLERFMERIEKKDIQFDEFRRSITKSHVEEEELKLIDPALRSFINVNCPDDLP
ncbi:Molybdenum cofactor guanylyltransferase [hydrothermal vent metagenome]|uniref:Molybdenum cofactor guanylyltransferase n=1 Tax=hydrothermal vent metagenome TaxID=652676 RepID=A0A3B1D0V8_9ZZZZ